MDAKHQEYLWWIDTSRGELAELLVSQTNSNEEDAAVNDVGGTDNETTNMTPSS
jgi:hypothetical protein